MAVPNTVTNIREHIKEALKLSLVDAGVAETCISLDAPYGQYKDEDAYPLAKVWMGVSKVLIKHMGKTDTREDELFVVIAPWCTTTDFEEAISEIITDCGEAWNTDAVKAQMDPSMQPMLASIELVEARPIDTSTPNPRAAVRIQLACRYKVTN